MTVGIIVEIAVNFIQQVIFVGFLYLFFDKTKKKHVNIIGFASAVLVLFSMANYFTFNEMTLNHLDAIITVLVLLLYSLFFLRGKVYLRIIIPLIEFGLNIIVSFFGLFIIPLIGGKSVEEAVAYSTSFRYIFLLVSNLLYIFVLLLANRIKKRKLYLDNIYDILAFIVIPLLCMVAMYTDIFIFQKVDFNDSVLPFILTNLLVLIAVSGLIWFLLVKVSRNNAIKTDLLLSEQREQLYKKSVLSTNEQLKKLSVIKHDVKNNYLAINMLISNGEYDKAKVLCGNANEEFSKVYSPLHTENPILNAIFNVEFEKAKSLNIDFDFKIEDSLMFMQDIDIVSLVGNLWDNAIEYLSTIPVKNRKMSFEITVNRDYCCVVCKNIILSSVLSNNAELKSTKSDLAAHGMA